MQKLTAISFLKNLYLHTVSPSESFVLKITCAKTIESYLKMAVLSNALFVFIENLVAFFSYNDLVWLFHLVSESFQKVCTKVMYSSPTISFSAFACTKLRLFVLIMHAVMPR